MFYVHFQGNIQTKSFVVYTTLIFYYYEVKRKILWCCFLVKVFFQRCAIAVKVDISAGTAFI